EGASLRGAVLANTTMNLTELGGADLTGALTDKPVGRPVDDLVQPLEELLRRHAEWVGTGGHEGQALVINQVDLRGAPALSRSLLTRLIAKGCTFYGLDLSGAQLQVADLTGSDLRSVDLSHADLRGAHLEGANFCNADLRDANLNYLPIDDNRQVV